ncbi:PREDICTED: ubiquitin carboxyl-terminal hydrolase 47-like [Amphimedon queenslandica]|uniref:Ubiquitin carboxyl-terminal hydrolase 47 C-terminal domain-containing protein n=1 Tax=Amphimedon queenslandica TaxID=400682 RepID=A0AAN0J7C2_AMPQE|nr:PREDICTED: ubiquitin carboxyl-terminal hydrolase 47-like [Amphimedon queenslandica]|eukprot:XP_019852598.1 PREDICTED: ubiquitin carboxyl-terminal hydrolase 47-like [Amphimedon queenslandica]
MGDFTSMRMSFGSLFYHVGKIIKQKSPPLEEIKEYLSCCSNVLRLKAEQCSNLSSVLHLIQNECSLTNIELLHSVVEEMKVTDATRYNETYRTQLKEFCKSLSISLCLKKRFSSISHLQCETVTLVFDWEPEEHVLKDIKELLAKVSGKLLKIEYMEPHKSISVTCSFPFSNVGFTVLSMIENIHILMGQGLKKLTIGNLTLWRRQDVRQKEPKEKDDDLLHTEVISYIVLEEAEYKLRDAISSKEKDTIELKQKISMAQVHVPEEELMSVQSDTQSIEEEPLDKELTVLSCQFNEIIQENKELSDQLSKMKVDYLRSLSSNTDSAASKVRRGMALEVDDCKFHLQAMTSPDYQPLVHNKRIIENLQEKIALMNTELIMERKRNEKTIKDTKDLKETEHKRQREKKPKVEKEMCNYKLSCNHPITGKLMNAVLETHKEELLSIVLDKAYELMELAPHIPIERCRLVKYNYIKEVMDQSFDLEEFQHQTIGQLIGRAGVHNFFGLFLEICKENKTFKKYNDGGINLLILVVDLSTGEVRQAETMRAEIGWTVGELKQYIGELFNLNSSCMRLVLEEEYMGDTSVQDIRYEDGSLLKTKLYREDIYGIYKQCKKIYVSSNPEDYQKEYKDSLMYRYIDVHINSILLDITIPPEPEATSTTTNTCRDNEVMKIISANEEKKGKERIIQVKVGIITLAQLKEALVPLIGVPPVGFRVYGIRYNEEYEMENLDGSFKDIKSGSKLIVRLGRALHYGECRIELYLLQVNNTEFCKYMMESVVTEGIPVGKFKKQIIKEAEVQGIDGVLEFDKMRLRKKNRISPGMVYLDHRLITTNRELYVETLKGSEKKKREGLVQVYVIRWRPSQCSVDPIEEIILDSDDPKHIIEKLSELSESKIPVYHLFYAMEISFPVKISCLNFENKLKWNSIDSFIYSRLYDDGCVIYYKDNREKMKELTDKERSEIQDAEEARLLRIREFESQHTQKYCF